MNVHYCSDYQEMSQRAYESIIADLKGHPEQLICTATGSSPTGAYEKLARRFTKNPEYFKALMLLKLDEWGGIDKKEPSSCESYLQEKVIQPLQIPKDRFIAFDSNPDSPEKECARIQGEIEQKGPIDLCILGMGQNGHIGFNEPASSLSPHCHVAKLTPESLNHQMIHTLGKKPSYGLTLGMGDILKSKKIILFLTGANKKAVIQKFLSKNVTTSLPASFLWLHPNVECFIDSTAV
ncbi:MAG: galactosamine-6-phosphate isomerase [Maribacter sp.]|uniref:galactosamine-6-phosphate isomerase n=1 Tax=Maribacter sp. TaxID=1897614 RepID=UPI003C78AD53